MEIEAFARHGEVTAPLTPRTASPVPPPPPLRGAGGWPLLQTSRARGSARLPRPSTQARATFRYGSCGTRRRRAWRSGPGPTPGADWVRRRRGAGRRRRGVHWSARAPRPRRARVAERGRSAAPPRRSAAGSRWLSSRTRIRRRGRRPPCRAGTRPVPAPQRLLARGQHRRQLILSREAASCSTRAFRGFFRMRSVTVRDFRP